jgi:rhodanese-related sulfurtransferase
MTEQEALGYAGDITAKEAYSLLERNKNALLVDVRTKAEWSYVGVPDLSGLDKRAALIEWQEFPTMQVNANFARQVDQLLKESDAPLDAPVLFLCRSGVRSRAAAVAMTAAGRTRCFNIAGGFEGSLDDKRHRGALEGWKAEGLPWTQS